MAIAVYYGQFMRQEDSGARWKMPYLSVEQVASVGDTCQQQCMNMGYPISAVHHFVRLDNSPGKIKKQKRSPNAKLGCYTYSWFRPILIGNFVHMTRNGWLKVNSPWMIEEMKVFEMHYTATGKERMEHEEGGHDDRIFAAAMATFCPADTSSIVARSKHRCSEMVDGLPPIDLGEYHGQMISSRQMAETNAMTLEDVLYNSGSELERYRR